MQVQQDKRQGIVILTPVGSLDTRSAFQLEETLEELLKADERRFVLNLETLDLLTSAGIRVFLILGKRLEGSRGNLVLCALSEQVKTVLELSGLLNQFVVETSTETAVASLEIGADHKATDTTRSTLARLLLRLMKEARPEARPRPSADATDRSPAAVAIAALLSSGNDISARDESFGPTTDS